MQGPLVDGSKHGFFYCHFERNIFFDLLYSRDKNFCTQCRGDAKETYLAAWRLCVNYSCLNFLDFNPIFIYNIPTQENLQTIFL